MNEQVNAALATFIEGLPYDDRIVVAKRALLALKPEDRAGLVNVLPPQPEAPKGYGPRDPLATPHTHINQEARNARRRVRRRECSSAR